MRTASHGSPAWSSPWHELQRRLALGVRIETTERGAHPLSKAQILGAGSWLLRAQARTSPARLPA